MNNDLKNKTLGILVFLGRTMRSKEVTFNLDGEKLAQVNMALEELQAFINALNNNLIELREVEIPEQDIEGLIGDEE